MAKAKRAGRAKSGASTKAERTKPARAKARGKAEGARDASSLIEGRVEDVGGWRGEVLARVRAIIRRAVPGVVEEWKWEVPVWSKGGILCTGEVYAKAVKLTFPKGAALDDPTGMFNASLEGKVRRAVDIHECDRVDANALAALMRAAAALNAGAAGSKASSGPKASAKAVKLLAGGNPQIAKGHGEAPVRAYIAAMPGWKREVGERVDAIVAREAPGVRKAVKWNSALYGAGGGEESGWFLGVHCFARYVKLAFFRGAELAPPPPGTSKQRLVRYLDVREADLATFDGAQLAEWVRQASRLPGERM